MTELADHIEQTHHAYLREELPRLTGLVGKIREVHGERHPKLVEVQRVFLGLRDELMMHMMKEEQVLFPMIRQMEASDNEPSFDCGSVDNPIRVMEHEHDNAGNALARLNELTGGYLPPADACNTYRATLSGLQELELDLHLHIHKENNILFPRASEREKLLCGG
jgi:regulator of cell morphogenesis and NO signaling